MAVGQHAEVMLLPWLAAAAQAHRAAKGAPFTEAKKGLDAPAQGPGRSSHAAKLQAQGQLPAGGMGPGRRPQQPDRSRAVVAGGGAAIGAG